MSLYGKHTVSVTNAKTRPTEFDCHIRIFLKKLIESSESREFQTEQ